ncbi:MAG: hypothetical protein K2I00_03685, partial [Ruminococcus sp.]|nr:hypothetical protein [Ruminococcus sp.]
MSKMPNIHGGGANTNVNGLHFEQTTSLNDVLIDNGFIVNNGEVHDKNNQLIGYSKPKHQFRKFLKSNGVDLDVNSDSLLPDDAFINVQKRVVYIIEKKFQNGSGSVDEKLQTCSYKLSQYKKLISQMNYDTEYLYILNDWFKQKKYSDVLAYINSVGCHYFFNSIPLG